VPVSVPFPTCARRFAPAIRVHPRHRIGIAQAREKRRLIGRSSSMVVETLAPHLIDNRLSANSLDGSAYATHSLVRLRQPPLPDLSALLPRDLQLRNVGLVDLLRCEVARIVGAVSVTWPPLLGTRLRLADGNRGDARCERGRRDGVALEQPHPLGHDKHLPVRDLSWNIRSTRRLVASRGPRYTAENARRNAALRL